jgi:hypothetical protein
MNPNVIIIALIVIVALVYLIIALRKSASQKISLGKALNPFFKKEEVETDELTKSMQPIVDEIETKRVANFIKYWADKFENNRLTVEDVAHLNAKIAEGESNQVNGILAIHPNARTMFNSINADLKLKEEEALALATPAV